MPDSVYRGDGSVKVGYLYDALGTKLRKYSNQGGNRDYVAGIEYGATNIELIHTPEGVALRNSAGSYTYRYNLSDHLGNVRATVYRNPSNKQVEVLQRDDYYPFGKQRVVTAGINSYLYNGKEKQAEFGGHYDYLLVFVYNGIHELTSFGYGARWHLSDHWRMTRRSADGTW